MLKVCPSCEEAVVFSALSRFDDTTGICYACGVLEAVAQMVMTRNGGDPKKALVAPGVVDLESMPLATLNALVELLRASKSSEQNWRVN